MELSTAISLIQKGVNGTKVETWADLGAGDGLFTRALSTLIHKGSLIYAVDKKVNSMSSLVLPNAEVSLTKLGGDFQTLDLPKLDGILMANSLHFVKEQSIFLKRMREILNPGGRLLIVEYDHDEKNMWVPYPLSFDKLGQLGVFAGFGEAVKLHEVPSRFGRANIYAAKVEF